MYLVKFFVNNIEIKPPLPYKSLEDAEAAANKWNEEIKKGELIEYHTTTIEKI